MRDSTYENALQRMKLLEDVTSVSGSDVLESGEDTPLPQAKQLMKPILHKQHLAGKMIPHMLALKLLFYGSTQKCYVNCHGP